MKKQSYTIILFYKFARIEDPEAFKLKQKKIAERFDLKGRMLIGKEGINGTVEGSVEDTEKYIEELTSEKRFKDISFKNL